VKLKALVCDRQIGLEHARRAISMDWIAAFNSYVTGDTSIEVLASAE
jgi:hypothetical protein